MTNKTKIAYFSMEFALDPKIPNFAGGLGVLATDIVASCADMEVPVAGVSLIYHKEDDPEKAFNLDRFFTKRPETITLMIEERPVKVGVYQRDIKGLGGHTVPLYFLSTFFPENERWDRDLTRHLYAADQYTRLCQEVILGVGGVKMLRKLGYKDIQYFHMNEGHASLLTFQLLKECDYDEQAVIEKCRFTTHTPIPAGHDRFPYPLARQVMGALIPWNVDKFSSGAELHTTKLALSLSKKANGVSKKHTEVCQRMFPKYKFLGITNGVHHRTWIRGAMKELYTKYIRNWEKDPSTLKNAIAIPDHEVQQAFQKNKREMVKFINRNPNYFVQSRIELEKDDFFDEETLTIAFSRRFVAYKRPLLLFHDLDRLRELAYRKIQVIFSGACHPEDRFCNGIMAELQRLQKKLRGQVRLAVMQDRNLDTSALLVSGSDIWLNNPEPPMEASGTSGMKAAMNGGINCSGLDGWWLEAIDMDPKSGWAFGSDVSGHDEIDSDELYKTFEEVIDTYYNQPEKWVSMMKRSMALGAYFNTHRCVEEYVKMMWS